MRAGRVVANQERVGGGKDAGGWPAPPLDASLDVLAGAFGGQLILVAFGYAVGLEIRGSSPARLCQRRRGSRRARPIHGFLQSGARIPTKPTLPRPHCLRPPENFAAGVWASLGSGYALLARRPDTKILSINTEELPFIDCQTVFKQTRPPQLWKRKPFVGTTRISLGACN